jgi:hypothetical protein
MHALARTRFGRDLLRMLHRSGVARDAIDDALARELDALARDVAY